MAAIKVLAVTCVLISASLQAFAEPNKDSNGSNIGDIDSTVKPSEDDNDPKPKPMKSLFASGYENLYKFKVPESSKTSYTNPEDLSKIIPAKSFSLSGYGGYKTNKEKSFGEELEHQLAAEEGLQKDKRHST